MSQREVSIWRIDLDAAPAMPAGSLDATEQRRAASFHSAVHRRRFIAAHVALRELLSRQSGMPARDLPLMADEHGKPGLPARFGLHFNLTHSEDLGLVAISTTAALGIDVEHIHPLGDRAPGPDASAREELALARRHFSPTECAELLAIPEGSQRTHAFFAGWTRKEAWVKAAGTGLRIDLRQIETGLGGARQVEAFRVQPVDLGSLWAGRGFIAALAAAGDSATVRVGDFPGQATAPRV